jgi:hypothetical protein
VKAELDGPSGAPRRLTASRSGVPDFETARPILETSGIGRKGMAIARPGTDSFPLGGEVAPQSDDEGVLA